MWQTERAKTEAGQILEYLYSTALEFGSDGNTGSLNILTELESAASLLASRIRFDEQLSQRKRRELFCNAVSAFRAQQDLG